MKITAGKHSAKHGEARDEAARRATARRIRHRHSEPAPVNLATAGPARLRVKRLGNRIKFDTLAGYVYCLHLSRCNTQGQALAWVRHLSTKNWVTGPMICDFIDILDEAGVRVNRDL